MWCGCAVTNVNEIKESKLRLRAGKGCRAQKREQAQRTREGGGRMKLTRRAQHTFIAIFTVTRRAGNRWKTRARYIIKKDSRESIKPTPSLPLFPHPEAPVLVFSNPPQKEGVRGVGSDHFGR